MTVSLPRVLRGVNGVRLTDSVKATINAFRLGGFEGGVQRNGQRPGGTRWTQT